MKLPQPNVKLAPIGKACTEAEIRGVIVNPFYAGIPPYPQIVADELWVAAAARMIEEDGAEQFLVNLLYVLRVVAADAIKK